MPPLARRPDELEDEPNRDGSPSRRSFAPVHLPDDLVEALAAALDAEIHEPDISVRFGVLRRTRAILDAWLDGTMTTREVVQALRQERPSTDR